MCKLYHFLGNHFYPPLTLAALDSIKCVSYTVFIKMSTFLFRVIFSKTGLAIQIIRAIMGSENMQNRVLYVKCSPDGELPGNEKPTPYCFTEQDLRYIPAPVAVIGLLSRIVRGSRKQRVVFFPSKYGFFYCCEFSLKQGCGKTPEEFYLIQRCSRS